MRNGFKDAAWQVGAYVAAALLHIPLIAAVQDLGGARAASKPQGPNITLVDLPAPERLATSAEAAATTGDVAFDTTTALGGREVAAEAAETVTADIERPSQISVATPAPQTAAVRPPVPARTVDEPQFAAQPDATGDASSTRLAPVQAGNPRPLPPAVTVAAAVESDLDATAAPKAPSPQAPVVDTTARPSSPATGRVLTRTPPEQPAVPASGTAVAARKAPETLARPAAGGSAASLARTAVRDTPAHVSSAVASLATEAETESAASRPVADTELASPSPAVRPAEFSAALPATTAAAALAPEIARLPSGTPERAIVTDEVSTAAPSPSISASRPLAATETIAAAPVRVRPDAPAQASAPAPAAAAAAQAPVPATATVPSPSPSPSPAAGVAAASVANVQGPATAAAAIAPRALSGVAGSTGTVRPTSTEPGAIAGVRPVPGSRGPDQTVAPRSSGVASPAPTPPRAGGADGIAAAARSTPVDVPAAARPSWQVARAAAVASSTGSRQIAALGSGTGGAPGGPEADRGSELRDFVRSYDDDGCFLAVASQVSSGTFAVSGFSRDEAAWVAFNRALDARTGVRLATRSRQVSAAQCAALGFARKQADYPDFKARMALASDKVVSGSEVKGVIEGSQGRDVALLLVDDEGLVQDATRLLQPREAGRFEFNTPLTLTSGPVETVQLFVALVGEGSAALAPADKVAAEAYFAELTAEMARQGRTLDVAIAAFSVDLIDPSAR